MQPFFVFFAYFTIDKHHAVFQVNSCTCLIGLVLVRNPTSIDRHSTSVPTLGRRSIDPASVTFFGMPVDFTLRCLTRLIITTI